VAASIPSRWAWEAAVAKGARVRAEAKSAALLLRAQAAAVSSDVEVKTPLHPWANRRRPPIHQHALFTIATGYVSPEGIPYDRHYCHCGACFKTERTR
jgi:hypothetical protein